MSKQRREKQAASDKKLAANELLAEPKGQDLKGYRKTTDAERLNIFEAAYGIDKARSTLAMLAAQQKQLETELVLAKRSIDDWRMNLIRAIEQRKKADVALGVDPEDKEAVKDVDGVMYLREKKNAPKQEAKTPPPVALEPGKPVEIAPGIEATLNGKK